MNPTMPPTTEPTAAELDTLKRRTLERVNRCLRALLAGIPHNRKRCGKAACARSGRCRGFACEQHDDEA